MDSRFQRSVSDLGDELQRSAARENNMLELTQRKMAGMFCRWIENSQRLFSAIPGLQSS